MPPIARRSRARRLLRAAHQCASRPLLYRTHEVALKLLGIIRYAKKPPPGFRDKSASLIARLNSFVIER